MWYDPCDGVLRLGTGDKLWQAKGYGFERVKKVNEKKRKC